jgi:flagellar motor switch/type III secretory pathway protein FliN
VGNGGEKMAAAATQAPGSGFGEKTVEQKARTANPGEGSDACWRPVLKLPCELTVELPLPDFKVSDFMKLQPGMVISTGWRLSRDVPLRVNGTLIGWAEFEGAGKRLAVRMTELA